VPATGADVLVSALESLGVHAVFGLPGVHNLAAWEALRESPIRLIGVRHEQAAVYAADGFARATGQLGVAIVTTGPGAANTLAATGEAWASGSPVLVVATDIPSSLRRAGQYRGVLHECTDQAAMFAPVTKAQFAWPDVQEAIDAALATPTRPVYLEIATDLLSGPATVGPANRDSSGSRGPEVDVGWTERPLVWAGGGAKDREDEVIEIAESLGAPILTSYGGRGIGGMHDLAVGLPPHIPEAGELWDQADLVIVVGSDLDGINTQNFKQPQPDRIIALNATPIVNYDVDQYGDSLSLKPGNRRPWADPQAVRARALDRLRAEQPQEMDFLARFAEALPEDAVVAADMCIPGYWIAALHPFTKPRQLLYPMGWGTLGFGFPAAIGPAAASIRTVSVNGDGGFLFACGELATVAQQGLPLTIVVVDDGGYGMLRYDQQHSGQQTFGVDLLRPDFAALGESFGIPSVHVPDFGDDFAAALNSEPPNMVVVDARMEPPPTTSPRWYRSRPPR
jgi:thiamine pyrophosphate-dependent acetolactate synthase large subunit-like protein